MLINDEVFKLNWNDIPRMPVELSEESLKFWKEQKRRCIEGYWCCGKYMPGPLYFYINFWQILLNKDRRSKAKSLGRPELWDIHWPISYGLMEARGFSGFEKTPLALDLKRAIETDDFELEKKVRAQMGKPRDFCKDTVEDLGKALYLNQAKNYMWFGNRGHGKSYYVSGAVIGHEWIFNGAKEYILGDDQIVEIVVGAGEQKYSQDLLGKVKLGLTNLPGACTIHGKPYPAPFFRNYVGNFEVGKDTQAYRKIKKEGIWTEKMGSWIKHRTFQQSAFAASGTRPTWAVMEEAGLFNNLEATFDAMIDTMMNGQTKFGTQLFIGTGGDMDAGTVDAAKMFYDPETYNMVVYDDELEHKGKICMFIPTTLGTIDYKDKNGNTDLAKATKIDDEIREAIKRSSNAATALDARKQNQPRYPSEMFLSKSGNIFPRAELQTWLSELEANAHYRQAEDVVELIFDADGTLKPKLIDSDKAIRKFPHNPKHDDLRGAVVIYEHPIRKPDGTVPFGLYVSGTDPYDHDESGTESLGSTIIYKKISGMGGTQEFPVAEYTGRHERGSDAYYEQARRLILYYGGARNMHENNLIGMYKYFERKNCTHLMLDVPEYAKEVTGSQPNRQKGMHFGPAQIKHGELLIKNWLEEEIAPGRYQLTKLRSIALIKELISYNSKGNFDRVRAFMAIMYALQETYRQQADTMTKIKSTNQDPFFSRYDKQKDIISHSKPGFSW